MTLYDFSQELSKLNKEKNYKESLNYFKEHKVSYTTDQISGNEYIISAMLTALRHTNNFDNAFKFLQIYNIDINDSTKDRVLNAYGWVLFSKLKADNLHLDNKDSESNYFEDEELPESMDHHSYSKSEVIERIEIFIPLILKFKNDFSQTVFSNLFRSVIKYEKQKPNANWKFINELCEKVNPDDLSIKCDSIDVQRKGQTKKMELASDKENWYAAKSKAFIKMGKYQECYEISKQALEQFDKFHYSNDIWFARRIALAKKNLGNPEDAIAELNQILKKKKEWFIQKELAELYKDKGETENAFNLAIQAINNFGDLEYKVELIFLIGELLKEKNENELAFKHFSFSKLLRISNDWKIPSKLTTELTQFDIEIITIDKLEELKKELQNYWSKFKSTETDKQSVQKKSGVIEKLLHDNEKGKDGFIRYDQNKSIYFNIGLNNELCKDLKVGSEVNFKILPAIEGKKERAIILN